MDYHRGEYSKDHSWWFVPEESDHIKKIEAKDAN